MTFLTRCPDQKRGNPDVMQFHYCRALPAGLSGLASGTGTNVAGSGIEPTPGRAAEAKSIPVPAILLPEPEQYRVAALKLS